MKRLLTLLTFIFALTLLCACTDNSRARNYGGTETIVLPVDEKFINVTWKEENIWILTSKNDPATEYHFKEYSSWGILEGEIVIVNNYNTAEPIH